MCPIADGRAIAAAAPVARLAEFDGVGHTSLWLDGAARERAIEAVGTFIGGLTARPAPRQ
jgi:hypothetical protein